MEATCTATLNSPMEATYTCCIPSCFEHVPATLALLPLPGPQRLGLTLSFFRSNGLWQPSRFFQAPFVTWKPAECVCVCCVCGCRATCCALCVCVCCVCVSDAVLCVCVCVVCGVCVWVGVCVFCVCECRAACCVMCVFFLLCV